jgi:transcriptional regulator with XRE-family HTH domain
MNIRQVFGTNLKRIRLAKGMTQEGLEGASGFDRVYISGMERGVRNPSITAVATLADALAVDIAELFTGYRREIDAETKRAK